MIFVLIDDDRSKGWSNRIKWVESGKMIAPGLNPWPDILRKGLEVDQGFEFMIFSRCIIGH